MCRRVRIARENHRRFLNAVRDHLPISAPQDSVTQTTRDDRAAPYLRRRARTCAGRCLSNGFARVIRTSDRDTGSDFEPTMKCGPPESHPLNHCFRIFFTAFTGPPSYPSPRNPLRINPGAHQKPPAAITRGNHHHDAGCELVCWSLLRGLPFIRLSRLVRSETSDLSPPPAEMA